MTTAREKLYEEMVALVAAPATPTSESEIRKIMTRYRVQTKPGIDIPPGTTARDALGDRLLELWRQSAPDVKAKIGTAIDEFRMQLKSSSSPPSPARPSSAPRPVNHGGQGMPRASVPALEDGDDPPTPSSSASSPYAGRPSSPSPRASGLGNGEMRTEPRAPEPRVEALGAADPPSAAMRGRAGGPRSAEPVAGGPRKRGRTRGECPKCHSMGVVLARSYSGDEYFSCIYCGWQAYKPTEEDDPNASLAVRLLGQSPSEPPRE